MNATMTDTNLMAAIKLLGECSKWFKVYDLAGDHRRHFRQNIMSALMGQKIPATKCGITAIADEFYRRANIPDDCTATREKNFTLFCQSQFAV